MTRPNYIIFLTDDQGYGDLSCMGATDIRTPHLDALAAGGARFTDFYANSAVCSPTRAALMTGRYPGNAGVRSIIAGHRTATGLPADVPTLPMILGEHGYRTYMAGKWHLGLAEASRPGAKGFDRWFGFLAGCIDYYSHIFYWGMNKPGPGVNPTHDLWEDNREVWHNGEYFTTAVTRKAIGYLREASRANKPFVLYVAYNAPHYPMHAPAEFMERFAHLPWDRQVMAAMISAVDDGVGAIMAELTRLGVAEDTYTFFTSDNGPSRESRNWLDGTLDPYYGGTAGALKGHKFSLYDGGIRVPAIMHWLGTIPPGQVIAAPAASMDILPTCLAGAGIDASVYDLDGMDLLPLVARGQTLAERDLFWELQDQTALRRGDWKLVLNGRLLEGAPPEDAVHLANLADDPGERRNLADAEPRRTEAMKAAAGAWRAGIEQRWREAFDPATQGTVTHEDS